MDQTAPQASFTWKSIIFLHLGLLLILVLVIMARFYSNELNLRIEENYDIVSDKYFDGKEKSTCRPVVDQVVFFIDDNIGWDEFCRINDARLLNRPNNGLFRFKTDGFPLTKSAIIRFYTGNQPSVFEGYNNIDVIYRVSSRVLSPEVVLRKNFCWRNCFYL